MNNILWKDRKRTIFGLPLSFTKYSLTDERLFIETGLLNTRENEVRLYRILDVQLNISLAQRIFGVGTIHISSSDKSLKDFDLISIKNPREVKEQISELVEAQRDKKRIFGRELMSSEDENEELGE